MTSQGPWRVPGAQGGVVVRFPFADEFAQREAEFDDDLYIPPHPEYRPCVLDYDPRARLHKGEGLGRALIIMLMAVVAGVGIALLIAAAVIGV